MESRTIRPRFTKFSTDRDGFIHNICAIDKIETPWTEAVSDIVAAYRANDRHLRSVYIRGSVALGTAIPHLSDIDSFGVTQSSAAPDVSWIGREEAAICAAHTAVAAVEFHLISHEELLKNRRASLFAKTQSVCVFGHDDAQYISPFRLGIEAFSHALTFSRERKLVLQWIADSTNANDVTGLSRSIMKRFLRAAFEISMEEEGYYSRELYLCCSVACKKWPEHSDDFSKALSISIYGSSDKDEVTALLSGVGNWLGSYIDNQYPNADVKPCFIDGFSYLNLDKSQYA